MERIIGTSDTYPPVPGVPARLAECANVSRLLGADSFLTLHGGGNTSVKDEELIYVKASGFDLATITSSGFSPLHRTNLQEMLKQDSLSDTDMVEGFRCALIDATSASPSIEALLHNLLPFDAVLHSHADAIVTLTNTVLGLELPRQVFGSQVLYLPYCKPGFELAKQVEALWRAEGTSETVGIVLAHHGLFTFANDVRVAHRRHLELVALAAEYIERETRVLFREDEEQEHSSSVENHFPELVALSDACTQVTHAPTVVLAVTSPTIMEFLRRDDLERVTRVGPASLEHVIRTKRTPLLGSDVNSYADSYRDYFRRLSMKADVELTMLTPEPRVILHERLGLVSTGKTVRDALIAQDIYRHTMRIIEAAEMLGGYRTISEADAFDIEYWELEQRKLR